MILCRWYGDRLYRIRNVRCYIKSSLKYQITQTRVDPCKQVGKKSPAQDMIHHKAEDQVVRDSADARQFGVAFRL